MDVNVQRCVLLWVALWSVALHCPAPAYAEHGRDATPRPGHRATSDSALDRREFFENDLSKVKEHHAAEEVSGRSAHDVPELEVIFHTVHRRSSLVSDNETSQGTQPKQINSTKDNLSTDVGAESSESHSDSVHIIKQNSTMEPTNAEPATHTKVSHDTTEPDGAGLESVTEREVMTEGATEQENTVEPSYTTEPYDEVTEANNVTEQESETEGDAAMGKSTREPSDASENTPDTRTTVVQENDTEDEEPEVLEPVEVEKTYARKGCKTTCLRKCCPKDFMYDMDIQACRRAEDVLMLTDVTVVVGFPTCRKNFSVIPVLATDGKSRLKLGSYSVRQEYFCSDTTIQGGMRANESLVCNEKREDSFTVNMIRKTSIIGNIISALSITFIYLCHIFIPKLNEKQGCLFLFFCTAVFAKAIFEAPGRAVKFRAYPNYAVCVINSLLLMFARASVPIWLSVLSIDIARKASAMSSLTKLMNSGSGARRWIWIYIAYGLGLTFLEWILALLLTNLSNHTQKQSVIYDRTCLFTDRDIRNYVFFYPTIGLMAVCVLLMAYAHRYRKVWCTQALVQGSRTVEVNLEEAQHDNPADGGAPGRGNQGGPGNVHEGIFRAHSAFDFVAGFWQQVSLVFFWVLLTTFMLLVQLTGRGVLSHITYLMDSFQGFYVFIIFICNRQKRVLVLKKLENVYKKNIKNKMCLPGSLPFQTQKLASGHSFYKFGQTLKKKRHGPPLTSVSTLELTSYPSKSPILPKKSTSGLQKNSPMYLSAPMGVSVCSGLSQMTEVPYFEDSSRETSPDAEEGPTTAQIVPPSGKPLPQETPVIEVALSSPEASTVSGRPFSDEALSISKAIRNSMALGKTKTDTQSGTSSVALTYEPDSPEISTNEVRSSPETPDASEIVPGPKTFQPPEASTSPGAPSIPTPPSSPETPVHQDFTSTETRLSSEIRTSSATPSKSEPFPEFPELHNTDSSFKTCPSSESFTAPETPSSVESFLSPVTPPSSETPSIEESPDPEVPPPLPQSFSLPEAPSPPETSNPLETSHSPSPSPTPPTLSEPRLSETSPLPEGDSFPEVSSAIPIPLNASHSLPLSVTPKCLPLHQVHAQNPPSLENFHNSLDSPEEYIVAGLAATYDDVTPPSKEVISNCLRSPGSSDGPPTATPPQLILGGAVDTESTWL